MGLFVGNRRVAPVVRVNVTPNFKGVFNLVTDLGLSIGATESQIATALATEITTAIQYDYCLVEIPDYQVYNGYSAFESVDDYIGYYVIYNDAYVLIDDSNKSSSGITAGTTIAYILNNAYSVVRYNFDGTDWTSADNSGYANIDASNFTDSGTTFLSGLGMPSNRYETLTVGAPNSTYTAPANGWFSVRFSGAGSNCGFQDPAVAIRLCRVIPQSSGNTGLIYPVIKGEKAVIYYNTNTIIQFLNFIYAEGTPTPTPPQP